MRQDLKAPLVLLVPLGKQAHRGRMVQLVRPEQLGLLGLLAQQERHLVLLVH